jgi:hypothetical protein
VTSDANPLPPPDLTTASDTGASNTDNITADQTPTFAGAGASANARVVVFADGAPLGETTADATGNWIFTPSANMAAGTYSIQWAQGPPGGLSGLSAALSVAIQPAGILPLLITHVF